MIYRIILLISLILGHSNCTNNQYKNINPPTELTADVKVSQSNGKFSSTLLHNEIAVHTNKIIPILSTDIDRSILNNIKIDPAYKPKFIAYKNIAFEFSKPMQSTIPYDYVKNKNLNTTDSIHYTSHDLTKINIAGQKIIQAGHAVLKENAVSKILNINTDQGLETPLVYSLFEDKNSNIWISHNNGNLSIYNGNYLLTFTGKNSLPFEDIRNVAEDSKGRKYIATYGGGIIIWDGTTFFQINKEHGLISNEINCIKVDNSDNLYTASSNGISIINIDWDKKKANIYSYTKINDSAISLARDILIDKKNNIWVVMSKKGIIKIDFSVRQYPKVLFELNKSLGLIHNETLCISQMSNNDIYIGYYYNGFTILRQKDDTYQLTNYFDDNLFNKQPIINIFEDKNKEIYLCTVGDGLYHLPVKGDQLPSTYYRYSIENGLPSNLLFGGSSGKSVTNWIGTYDAGICKIDLNTFRFWSQLDTLVNLRTVQSITEDSEGKIWMVVDNVGLVKMEPEGFSIYNTDRGLHDNYVMILFCDRLNRKYIVSQRLGLSILHKNKFISINKESGLNNNTITGITEDQQGRIWVSSIQGLNILSFDQNSNLVSIKSISSKEGLPDHYINSLATDKNGNIIIGFRNVGVGILDVNDINNLSIKLITTNEGLSSNNIVDAKSDKYGNIIASALNEGIDIIYQHKDSLISVLNINKKSGLSSDLILSMSISDDARIFANGQNGLNVIKYKPIGQNLDEIKKITLNEYTKKDGLIGSSHYIYSSYIDKHNHYWFGSNGGLTRINIDNLESENKKLSPTLQYIEILDTLIDFIMLDSTHILHGNFDFIIPYTNIPVNLKLPYSHNYITFHYGANNLDNPHRNVYTYKLAGYDKEWSAITSELKVEYKNLPPGKYTYILYAARKGETWSDPYTYTFTIVPPWYLSWWAYFIYGTLLLLGIRSYGRYKAKRLELQKQELEEVVQQRTEEIIEKTHELEQSLQTIQATQNQLVQSEKMASLGELTAGIAHEIQNPLNFVNNFSDVSQELLNEVMDEIGENSDPKVIKGLLQDILANLNRINYHGKRADAIVKSMLQHSRSSAGAFEKTDLNKLCDEYLKLAYHGMRAKDKTFNAAFESHLDPTIEPIHIIPQEIGRVILNLLNNAFYAVSEYSNLNQHPYQPKVVLTTKSLENNWISIEISDNGPGIPNDIMSKIFQPFFTTKPTGKGTGLGLSLAYDIITKTHNGKIAVENDNGAKFTILLPDNPQYA